MDFSGKKVLVVGFGKTGKALVAFLTAQGAEVLVSDIRNPEVIQKEIQTLLGPGRQARVEGGGHTPEFFRRAEIILVSPGVPLDLPALKAAEGLGIPIWGELEVFARWVACPVVAVTGTNGKTTTTALLNEMLTASGVETFLGGNIGRPLIEYLLADEQPPVVVAEISSFQLDTTVSFTPKVGLLLNITDDHLDRYPDFEAYAASKAGLFRNQGPEEAAVLNADDPTCRKIGAGLSGPTYFFSLKRKPSSPGAWLEGNQARIAFEGWEETYDLGRFPLPGTHNQENALAAILGARLMGADPRGVQEALNTFKGFGHRLEWVAEIDGVRFYDDSKATNVGAVYKALEGFDRPVILIAGGRDKGGDYYPLIDVVREKVKALILIGEAQDKMAAQLGGATRTEKARSLEEAVGRAFALAEPGEAVLLSPACSSFDMFRDYVHRGEVFQSTVRGLLRRGDHG